MSYASKLNNDSSFITVVVEDRQPLTFAHSNGNRGNRNEVLNKLREICSTTSDSVKPDTPRLFVDLTRLMKSLDSNELEGVYRTVKSSGFCESNQRRVQYVFYYWIYYI